VLINHGMWHCLGYDHESDEDYEIMKQKCVSCSSPAFPSSKNTSLSSPVAEGQGQGATNWAARLPPRSRVCAAPRHSSPTPSASQAPLSSEALSDPTAPPRTAPSASATLQARAASHTHTQGQCRTVPLPAGSPQIPVSCLSSRYLNVGLETWVVKVGSKRQITFMGVESTIDKQTTALSTPMNVF